MLVWYIFNSLITILPLFAVHVLDIDEGIIITLALVASLGVAALLLPVHAKLGQKIGMRNAFMVTLASWIGLLFPFVFLSTGDVVLGIIITAIQGFALSGCMFYVDILHGAVIDEDALNFGVKRSASFYGINAFIHRFSTILVILTIGIVFQGTSWAGGYTINPGVDVIIGIKLIMVLFPSIACGVAVIILSRFKLHGERLENVSNAIKKAQIK
jgi:Na+/melibiose symporter-like transporter